MIGTPGGANAAVAVAMGTLASVVIIITTMRAWLRSYVDERAGICIDEKLGPLATRVAVLEAQRGGRH